MAVRPVKQGEVVAQLRFLLAFAWHSLGDAGPTRRLSHFFASALASEL